MTRWEEQSLGWTILDAATADEMGREQVGWFISEHPGLSTAVEQFANLDSNPEGGVWVVVPHSQDLASQLFCRWPYTKLALPDAHLSNDSPWRSRKVWVAIPEDLKQLLPIARGLVHGLAGLIIFDPECIIYKARGGRDWWGTVHRNDRPQHVVNFRAALDVDGWQPPLILLTTKPAKAVNTTIVARVFCLNAFRFISGDSFGCWDVPIEQENTQ
jgi:hypothetical protein